MSAPESKSQSSRAPREKATFASPKGEGSGSVFDGKGSEDPVQDPPKPGSLTYLGSAGRARIELLGDWPWSIDVDAAVIPTGGQLASAWLQEQQRRQVSDPELSNLFQPSGATPADRPAVVLHPNPGVASGPPRYLVVARLHERNEDLVTEADVERVVGQALDAATRIGCRTIALPVLGCGSGGLKPELAARSVVSVLLDHGATQDLDRVVLVTNSLDAAKSVRDLFSTQGQSFGNDVPDGEDLLELKSEIHALADMLLLRETKPPLVVGVFGGWGSGKSFVMHLMRERLLEVRSWPVTDEEAWGPAADRSPFVGHVYPITFDAWTFAKGNLWASLMQTVFVELDRALSLERWAHEEVSEEEGLAWRLLMGLDGADAQTLRDDPRAPEALRRILREPKSPGQEGLSKEGALWESLRRLQDADRKALREEERKLAKAKAALAEFENGFARDVDADLSRKMRGAAWKPLLDDADVLLDAMGSRARERLVEEVQKKSPDARIPSIEEVIGGVSIFRRVVKMPPAELLAFASVVALSLAGPLLVERLEFLKVPGGLVGALSLALAAWRGIESFAKRVQPLQERYDTALKAERERIAGQREELIRERLAMEELETTSTKAGGPTLRELRQNVRDLESKVTFLRGRVSLTSSFVSLADLVRSRLDAAVYVQHLGLVHQVQQDLHELTRSLVTDDRHPQAQKQRDLFYRGPPRVVLFIDDLDRCPPETVVAVLEAAQLLVKTELFVVVLAMDVRYVTRTLEKHYSGVLVRNGDPSGLDYIEKIIQVPYRVRPIGPTALRNYLRAQMRVKSEVPATDALERGAGGAGEVPGAGRGGTGDGQNLLEIERCPPRVLEFTKDELEALTKCCDRLDLSPRALKRLVNVYRLLKILWYRSKRHPRPDAEGQAAVLFMLALSSRYPDVMREPFEHVADAIADEARCVHPLCKVLADFGFPMTDKIGKRAWDEEVRPLFQDASFLSQKLTLAQLGGQTFNLVRSFSFLGDSGLEPGDIPESTIQIRALAANTAPAAAKSAQRESRVEDKAADIASRTSVVP